MGMDVSSVDLMNIDMFATRYKLQRWNKNPWCWLNTAKISI
jgi:hypothetical protein